jgi:CDP-diacylglycerol--inositol 3-phosphatidyltransferase
LAGLSLHFMSYHPKYSTLLYGVSCLLDAVDGQAARALGQTSKFGAVLDMVTDRCMFLVVYEVLRAILTIW